MPAQTVLAIDDSPDIHQLLELRLKPEGLRMHHALDAEDGLEKARALVPDLILLDVDMPYITGFEVCQRLKADPVTAAVPVIFLTGSAEVHSKVAGFDAGAVDYVTKPFEPAELRARVRSALRAKRYVDMLAMRAQIDGLTGLWNRSYFDQRLAEEISAAHRYRRPVSLILADVDHFKAINDNHGHPFGDLVLQTVGETLSASARATDLPCRYGGEEFGIILPETDAVGAAIFAERLRKLVSDLAWRERSPRVVVTASFGVAFSGNLSAGSGLSAKALVSAADAALYDAKRSGRDRVCCAPRG
jgi:two-component system, cell cycle response regulator